MFVSVPGGLNASCLLLTLGGLASLARAVTAPSTSATGTARIYKRVIILAILTVTTISRCCTEAMSQLSGDLLNLYTFTSV